MSKGMDERHKAGGIAVTGAAREKALRACRTQLEVWKLVMPPHQPLVSDFGVGDFYQTGLIEYWVANEIEAGYCGKLLFVFDGQTCPTHWHQGKHETFFIVRGEVEMVLDGTARVMRAGDCLPVPPGKPHRFTGQGPALLLEVSTPCLVEDNLFENQNIPSGGTYP
ncbi:MAG: D-lyxose/D-mannose family sugar isomerase [Lentisphaerae bacterium]|nr:D-lyxose/D-mannose family sugar isomerase [Lentisphaerota bacterium]